MYTDSGGGGTSAAAREIFDAAFVGGLKSRLSRYAEGWTTASMFGSDALDLGFEEPSILPVSQAAPEASFQCRYHAYDGPAGHGPWVATRRLALLPALQRLNYCKQLSTTNIRFNLDATHNRLTHMLGTHDLCAALIQSLCHHLDEKDLPPRAAVVATLLYAVIHDIYHGPMGHSMDVLCVGGRSAGNIDKQRLHAEIVAMDGEEPSGLVWELVQQTSRWIAEDRTKWNVRVSDGDTEGRENLTSEIRTWMIRFRDATTVAQKSPRQFWLYELVDGSLDADRLDYIQRDTELLHQWHGIPSRDRLHGLIRGARVLKAPAQAVNENLRGDVYRVHWDLGHLQEVEQLLALRSKLYRMVYQAPGKRVFDEMIAHSLWYGLGGGSVDDNKIRDLLSDIVGIADDELFHFMQQIEEQPECKPGAFLMRDVAAGRPFVELLRIEIPGQSLEEAVERGKDLMDRLTKAFDVDATKTDDNRQKDERAQDQVRDARRVLGVEVARAGAGSEVKAPAQQVAFALVYVFADTLAFKFAERAGVERMLWNRCREDEVVGGQFRDFTENVISRLYQCQRSSDGAVRYAYDLPWIFISVPWVSQGQPREADLNPRSGELFHLRETPWTTSRESFNRVRDHFYPICLFAPKPLADDVDVVKAVRRLFIRLLTSCAWNLAKESLDSEVKWWEESESTEDLEVAFDGIIASDNDVSNAYQVQR